MVVAWTCFSFLFFLFIFLVHFQTNVSGTGNLVFAPRTLIFNAFGN
jgi:hypothetical protein